MKTYLQDETCQLRGVASSSNCSEPVNILIDSGATEQFLSTEIARKLQVPIEKDTTPYWVQMANGAYAVSEGKATITLRISKYIVDIQTRILDIPGYDLVLGLDWLRLANPEIDWQQMIIRVKDETGYTHSLSPTDTTATRRIRFDTPTVPLLRLRPALRAIAKVTTKLFLGCLRVGLRNE